MARVHAVDVSRVFGVYLSLSTAWDIGNQSYSLRYIEACFIETVSEVITQSQNLTFLKIKDLNPETVDELVSTALQACPKLTHLEIVETPQPTGKYILNVKLHFSKHNSRYNIIIKNSR